MKKEGCKPGVFVVVFCLYYLAFVFVFANHFVAPEAVQNVSVLIRIKTDHKLSHIDKISQWFGNVFFMGAIS